MKLRVVALLTTLSIGCATATDDYEGIAPGRRVDGGALDNGFIEEDEDTGTTSTETDTGASATDSGTSATDSEPSADSGSAPVDTGTPPAGGACTTLTAADCTSASSIGTVSGDTGS